MVRRREHRRRSVAVGALVVLLTGLTGLVGCSGGSADGSDGSDGSSGAARGAGGGGTSQVDAGEAPEVGACRSLAPADVAEATNAAPTVDCGQAHNAETYAAGDLPDELAGAGYDDAEIGAFAYETCGAELRGFLGADESLALRTTLTWAWFRPSREAWEQGSRWYRCDVVGGNEQSSALAELPVTAEGLLEDRPDDRWLVCVSGPSVSGAPRIPCTEAHDWRAVTTIKLGEPRDPYPGDRLSEVRTRDFCYTSVRAWLNYPDSFEYGYTWFHEAEWDAGNRRSVCWARTTE